MRKKVKDLLKGDVILLPPFEDSPAEAVRVYGPPELDEWHSPPEFFLYGDSLEPMALERALREIPLGTDLEQEFEIKS